MIDLNDLLEQPMPELTDSKFVDKTVAKIKSRQQRFQLIRLLVLSAAVILSTTFLALFGTPSISDFSFSTSIANLVSISIEGEVLAFVLFFALLPLFYLSFDALELN